MKLMSNILEPLMPEKFDENEIFSLCISILVSAVLYFIHKKYKEFLGTELLSLYFFNLLLITLVESTLAEPPIDFYDTLDFPHAELFDIILQVAAYPIQMIILIYFYPLKSLKFFPFVLIGAAILTALELISLQFNLFQFNKWHSGFSFLFYCFAVGINMLFFSWFRKVIKKRIKKTDIYGKA
ncbi:hypothetical protein [Bacillus sp. AK031]